MLRVLCIDGEGGWGGSSRSLAKSLSYVDRAAVSPEVWCRREGPILDTYAQLGVPCRVMPDIPAIGAVSRPSRNIASEVIARAKWLGAASFRRQLISRAADVDVVHFNLETQWWLAKWLRRRHAHAQTMHVRSLLPDNVFARRQDRAAAAVIDRFAFITENERRQFEHFAGRALNGQVIFNIADAPAGDVEPHPDIPQDGRLRVAILSNFAWLRGIDRLVDVADALARREGRGNVLFVIAGSLKLQSDVEGPLRNIRAKGGDFADYVRQRGFADMFVFLGHVSRPESVLVACDILVKPTRESNPWGRDILEALACGKPVMSVGTYDRFVEDGVTGFLTPEFDAGRWAVDLLALDRDRALGRRLGDQGAKRVAALCNGPARAADLVALWRDAVASRRH